MVDCTGSILTIHNCLMVAILLLSVINKSNPVVTLQIQYNSCKRTSGLVPGSGFYWQTGSSNLVLSTGNTRADLFHGPTET